MENFVFCVEAEVFIIKKAKNTAQWTYVISDLKGEEIVRQEL